MTRYKINIPLYKVKTEREEDITLINEGDYINHRLKHTSALNNLLQHHLADAVFPGKKKVFQSLKYSAFRVFFTPQKKYLHLGQYQNLTNNDCIRKVNFIFST